METFLGMIGRSEGAGEFSAFGLLSSEDASPVFFFTFRVSL